MLDQYHFIGINGIGMSALAKALCLKGHKVSGSDSSPNLIIDNFKELGISVSNVHEKKKCS